MVPTQGGVSFPLEWFILLFVITSRYYVCLIKTQQCGQLETVEIETENGKLKLKN